MPLDGRSRATMESRWIMYTFAGESALDPDALRSRLARMDDAALARFGRAAARGLNLSPAPPAAAT